MNFELINSNVFRVDSIDDYRRTYYVMKKNNGLLVISDVFTTDILLDNIDPSIITINMKPLKNINELQSVVYNKNCACDVQGTPVEFKIFDNTFDETFE